MNPACSSTTDYCGFQHHDHKHPRFENTASLHLHDHEDSHGHSHSHGHGHDHGDLGMMGVLLHVLCDAANNLGVMVAALVIWLARYDGRYYADPGVSTGIAIMIMISSIPLGKFSPQATPSPAAIYFHLTTPRIVRSTGLILLESAPDGVNLADVQHDLERVSRSIFADR